MNPVALVISGLDPSNHAGYGSDIRVMTSLGVHPVGVVTAVTVQVPGNYKTALSINTKLIHLQLDFLFSYYAVKAIKIGMLHSLKVCEAVLPYLRRFSGPIVVDPLLYSSAGPALLNKNARIFFKNEILSCATLVTPNLPEMIWLLGEKKTRSSLDLCFKFKEKFKTSVLLKGGHAKGTHFVEDIFFDGTNTKHWKRPRLKNLITHGTGCFLSSAIAAYLSKGFKPMRAIDFAQKKLSYSLQNPIQIDKNNYLSHF